ncbi:MAG TPA: hypothetical protein VGJ79_00240 [Candidatus Dormibacteraeota bacterium]
MKNRDIARVTRNLKVALSTMSKGEPLSDRWKHRTLATTRNANDTYLSSRLTVHRLLTEPADSKDHPNGWRLSCSSGLKGEDAACHISINWN